VLETSQNICPLDYKIETIISRILPEGINETGLIHLLISYSINMCPVYLALVNCVRDFELCVLCEISSCVLCEISSCVYCARYRVFMLFEISSYICCPRYRAVYTVRFIELCVLYEMSSCVCCSNY
jgi:hypothetical protein